MNKYALLAYAGRKLGYRMKDLFPIFNVTERTINNWCNEVYDNLQQKEISDFSLYEGCDLHLTFVGGSKELERIERRNVWKRPMTK